MKIFNDISLLRQSRTVVTIGIFDGVHKGHVEILKRIKHLAAEYAGESVVITLWPHPRFVLDPANSELRLLTTLEEKTELIRKQGIDNLIVLPFDKQLANITYDRFVSDFIVRYAGAVHVVVGFNHHFGKDRKGTFENLQISAKEHGIQSERLNQVFIDDLKISSSGIRHMIEEGRISTAAKALGYPYFINGKVVEGNKIGRSLGFPTANLQLSDHLKLLPRNGVYAVLVKSDDQIFEGMLSIGLRPTIEMPRHERTIEAHLFDFEGNLYNKCIKIAFIEWLRCEKKFGSLEELKDQMHVDKKEALRILHPITEKQQLI